ncbi:MAG: FAD-binding protein [Myxococcales bacterium]|nr:FAD-binding protein [Myxococcales bacterium]MCB9532256.1 FAD-binding protein [Myxococcales bacterium]MCB9533920.1 FAD-binding protein [Myxococcales bacterium]
MQPEDSTATRVTAPPARWDGEADVVVVGLGGAGVCAALEARAAGASVLALDRFEGGGATAISGGVVYAGGGTQIQTDAGVTDSVDAMFGYLQLEVAGVVSDPTLREFCERSVENLDWLREHGVPFEGSLCPVKTSYPSDRYYLYASGNEFFEPYRDVAKPAARGHRAKGTGLPGANFFAPLAAAAARAGVETVSQARVESLVVDGGRVVGVAARVVTGPLARFRHRLLAKLATKLNPYAPKLARRLRRALANVERTASATRYFAARRGVVLATGGFIYNRELVEKHAPRYRPGMPLGTTGCNGDGILLGAAAGGTTDKLDRVSAWRFINPPEAFVRGILVDRTGERVANERLYGAQIGRKMVEEHRGEAILIIDRELFDRAVAECKPGTGIQWFQQAPALLNLFVNRKVGASLEALARAARIDPDGLARTVERYNSAANTGAADEKGKDPEFLHALERGPFYAIDCGIASRGFPCPTLTLGGLRVDEGSGAVVDDVGAPIRGLFAAGRAAIGVCSSDYVSGLSLADCVFSGRRAGASAADET